MFSFWTGQERKAEREPWLQDAEGRGRKSGKRGKSSKKGRAVRREPEVKKG